MSRIANVAAQLAKLGNAPSDHEGMCLIRLPGGGQHTVASDSLRLFAEGVIGQRPDGRKFFSHVSGLVVIDLKPDGTANGPAEPEQQQ